MRYRAATNIIVGAVLLLMLWDAALFNWARSYDAAGSDAYIRIMEQQHRLPVDGIDTSVWHNPPLFFLVAAAIKAAVGLVYASPQRALQLFDIACGLGLMAVAYVAARELFPGRRSAPVVALGFVAFTPVFVRVSIMYHPEPLATLLAMAAALVVLRGQRQGTLGPRAAALAGLLGGLGVLTRSWAVPVTGAILGVLLLDALWRRERRALAVAGVFAVVALAVSLPWFVREQVQYGHPFAFNLTTPDKPLWRDQPASFYVGLGLPQVFTHPIAPAYRNRLLPTMYSDWWGDYTRSFDVPIDRYPMTTTPPHAAIWRRQIQSVVGLLPTLLMIVGTVALAVRGFRRRDAASLVLPASLAALLLAFLYFVVAHPRPYDVETLKAVYILDAVVPLAVGAAYVVERLRSRALLVALALLAVAELPFLVLTHRVT